MMKQFFTLCLLAALFLVLPARLAVNATAAAAPPPDCRLGFAAPVASSPQEIYGKMDAAVREGRGAVSVLLDWNRVQPKKGAFYWRDYDELARVAKARGMEVVFVLGPTAEWASRAPAYEPREDRIWKMPKNWPDWQNYVGAAVAHFRGRVKYWQIWEGWDFQHFRAPASQVATLARIAYTAAKAANPDCLLILPEPGGIDLAWIDALRTTDTWKYTDILGLRPFASQEPDSLLLPLAVLQSEVLRKSPKPVWIVGRSQGLAPARAADTSPSLARLERTAFSCGVQRVFSAGQKSTKGAGGEVAPSGVVNRAAALAQLPAADLPKRVVWDLNATAAEKGLYQARFRNWPGGKLLERDIGGKRALGTQMQADLTSASARAKENPWIYFDVDDRFLFFSRGRNPIAITIECLGANGPKSAGFNIYYDAGSRQRFTSWQWIDAGEKRWFTYRIVLPDAWLANKDGYDFRINAKGSKEDVYISRVEVEPLYSER